MVYELLRLQMARARLFVRTEALALLSPGHSARHSRGRHWPEPTRLLTVEDCRYLQDLGPDPVTDIQQNVLRSILLQHTAAALSGLCLKRRDGVRHGRSRRRCQRVRVPPRAVERISAESAGRWLFG